MIMCVRKDARMSLDSTHRVVDSPHQHAQNGVPRSEHRHLLLDEVFLLCLPFGWKRSLGMWSCVWRRHGACPRLQINRIGRRRWAELYGPLYGLRVVRVWESGLYHLPCRLCKAERCSSLGADRTICAVVNHPASICAGFSAWPERTPDSGGDQWTGQQWLHRSD